MESPTPGVPGEAPEDPLHVCRQLAEDHYWVIGRAKLPLWALFYTATGLLYIILLSLAGWKLVDRTNSPRSRRLFSVVCWVVTIGLLAIGVVHFSASFDQGLLTVTKMVMTVFVHVVIFACQAATIFYYFTCEDLSITLNRRVQRAIVPALGFAVAFGITESTFMGVYWSSTVLQRGIGALNVFWTVVRTFWVIVYAGTFLMGVLPQTLVRLPSPSAIDIHIMLMLLLQMVGLVGEIGSIIYTDFSTFGCISGATFLAEYPLFVVSLWLSSAWIFRAQAWAANSPSTNRPINVERRHIITKSGDSDYAFLSDEHATDRY